MFYTEHDIEEETKFIHQVMTRGLESQERVGLHASSLIVGDKVWCTRQEVLSLLYKQVQKENTSIGLLRIFEEGNAIHEKWQRLLIRAGYGKAKTMDRTRFNTEYEVSYTPDIVCRIPEFFDGVMVGEIKSVNSFSFKKMTEHPSAKKQLQLYMFLCIQEAMKKEHGTVKTTQKDLFFVIRKTIRTSNYSFMIMTKTFFLRILIVWKRSSIEKKSYFRNIK